MCVMCRRAASLGFSGHSPAGSAKNAVFWGFSITAVSVQQLYAEKFLSRKFVKIAKQSLKKSHKMIEESGLNSKNKR